MVSYYDRNKSRIRAVEKALEAGTITQAEAERKIAALAAKPDFWVRGYDGPKEIRKHVDPPHSEAAAKRLASRLEIELGGGNYTPEGLLKVTYTTILEQYLTKKRGKDKSAISYAEAAKSMLGTLRLSETHDRVNILVRHFLDDLPKRWPVEKTRWNYVLVLQAAVQWYLDQNQKLNIKNPVRTAKKVAEMRRGTRKRQECPTLDEYRMHVYMAKKKPFPEWFWVLVVAYGESGFRGDMIVSGFRWERLSLEHIPGRQLPYINIKVSKQKGEKRDELKQFPISKPLVDALGSLPGPKEYGPVFPIKNIPRKHWKRLFKLCKTERLVPHDYRRFWKIQHLEFNPKLTADGMGQATLSMDQDYTILKRKELEALYSAGYEE